MEKQKVTLYIVREDNYYDLYSEDQRLAEDYHNIFGKILSLLLKETNRLENGEKIELSITKTHK